jgi:hypothetical protein
MAHQGFSPPGRGAMTYRDMCSVTFYASSTGTDKQPESRTEGRPGFRASPEVLPKFLYESTSSFSTEKNSELGS